MVDNAKRITPCVCVHVCCLAIIPLRCYSLNGSHCRSMDGRWSKPPPQPPPPPPLPRSRKSTDVCRGDVNNDDDDSNDNVVDSDDNGDGVDDGCGVNNKDADNNAVAIRSSDRSTTNCHQSIQNPICQFLPIYLFTKLKTNRLQFTRNNLSFGCSISPQCDCNMCTMNPSA